MSARDDYPMIASKLVDKNRRVSHLKDSSSSSPPSAVTE